MSMDRPTSPRPLSESERLHELETALDTIYEVGRVLSRSFELRDTLVAVLKAMDHGVGTDERRTPVPLNNQIGALAEDVSAAAITIKIIGEQTKVLNCFHIEIQTATTTGGLESLQG